MAQAAHVASELHPLAVYSATEAAGILRESVRKLRDQVKAGQLHPLPYATGKHLFSGAELIRFIGGPS